MCTEDLAPFRFELIFTGLCLFDITPQGATVLLVNAAEPKKFREDPNLESLEPDSFPNPHVPRFSYLMTQQVRDEDENPPRPPDLIVAGPLGEEAGICHLEGEDLTLKVTGNSPFEPGPLEEAPDLSSVSPHPFRRSDLTSSALPNDAVVTRFHFANGTLSVHRLSSTGTEPLRVDFQKIKKLGESSGGPERTIADQLVLRVDNLRAPVEIQSNTKRSILLRPEQGADGGYLRPVMASLSNYHQIFHEPQIAAFDFLWFYELVEFTSPQKPPRNDLPIPVYLNGFDTFTGSSGVCPPIKIGGGT